MEQYGSLKEDDRIRGSTPAELASRCLAMCQAYIGGSWTLAKDASEVEVQRITGGLTNQLYSVQLLDSVPSTRNEVYPNEPRKVAVKLFQKKLINPSFGQCGESERLSDVVVLTLLSQAEVCPKVYGIFDDGFVQTFYEARNTLQVTNYKSTNFSLFFTSTLNIDRCTSKTLSCRQKLPNFLPLPIT